MQSFPVHGERIEIFNLSFQESKTCEIHGFPSLGGHYSFLTIIFTMCNHYIPDIGIRISAGNTEKYQEIYFIIFKDKGCRVRRIHLAYAAMGKNNRIPV